MRAFIGLAVLGALCWMAATWQGRFTDELRAERSKSRRFDTSATLEQPADDGWSTLVVGRPSGADPVPAPTTGWAAAPAGRSETASPVATGQFAPAPEPDIGLAEHVVANGEVLGTICQGHYGSRRGAFRDLTELADAVATFNDLKSANAIKTGQVLYLPQLAVLERGR